MRPTFGNGRPWYVRWAGAMCGLLCVLALGLGSAWLALRSVSAYGVSTGVWRSSMLAGNANADLYTRARVALGGLLALQRDETMYYLASTDLRGKPLRSQCSYRVRGVPPGARWWSVTVYADDMYLFDHPDGRYSVHSDSAPLDSQGRFTLVTGPQRPAGTEPTPWLPTPGERGVVFTLRLYNPDPVLAESPGSLQAPTVEPIGSCS